MASIKIVLRDKTTNDGLYPVILRITNKRKSKIISLNLKCSLSDWDDTNNQFKKSFPNHTQSNLVLAKKRELAFKIINQFELDEVDFSLEQFEEKFRGIEPNKTTVLEFWEEVISDLNKSGKAGNAIALKETKNSFFTFCKKKNLMFKEINPYLLDKYEVFLRENKNADGGVAFKMRELRSLFNKAIKKGVVEEKHYPFKIYKVSKLKIGNIKKALTRDEVRLIENFDETLYPNLAEAKRLFLFSYYCRGINFFDIMQLEWSNISGGRITYIRSKTKGKFNIGILKPAQNILDYYKNVFSKTKYVFPILLSENMTPTQIQNRKHKKLKKFNSDLKKIAVIVGIDKPLSSYVARHSYATNLKQLGVSTDIVSQSMGHQNVAITSAYLKDFEDDVIDKENEKLLNEPLELYF
ncbi:site-specific integrase [Flavobacterium terrigena]|uniref:Site-specific recombinase XerD n=1 Tax=Flavobacterium terrigena TaxID=402734 RepID=A0A1H6T3U1_9FLAO|nr:site-specific integrase [Flavobacterium terrigena]SEI70925.1 Site-specific recombinase XerD [Flavobacterium terrigena]